MNQCKDCKWFKACKGDFASKQFSKKDLYQGFGKCLNKIFAEETYRHDSNDALMIYWDNEGLNAHFRVHESFGCIGWEGKE